MPPMMRRVAMLPNGRTGACTISRSSGGDDSLVDVQRVAATGKKSVGASRYKANVQERDGGHEERMGGEDVGKKREEEKKEMKMEVVGELQAR